MLTQLFFVATTLLVASGSAQDPQTPALKELAQARTNYFKALVKVTGGRLIVLPPHDKKLHSQWYAQVRGVRNSFIKDLAGILKRHPADPGLNRVRLCAGGELLRSHRWQEATMVMEPMTAFGLSPEETLRAGRFLAALNQWQRAAVICRYLEPGRLKGDREYLALAGILAGGGLTEQADKLLTLLFADTGGDTEIQKRVEEIERIAATFRPGVNRPLLALTYQYWVSHCKENSVARNRAKLIPGLRLGTGDKMNLFGGTTLNDKVISSSGNQKTIVLFWRREPASQKELERLDVLAKKPGNEHIRILGICLEGDQESTSAWLQKLGLPVAIHINGGKGFDSIIPQNFGITQTPFYFLLDQKHQVLGLGLTGEAIEFSNQTHPDLRKQENKKTEDPERKKP